MSARESAPEFVTGDRVQLTDGKGRHHTITLIEGGTFHSHRGQLQHDQLIGCVEGSLVKNSGGEEYLALRPLLSDFVMSMPRGAAIVYPKDAAQLLSLADIFPGARVVEAGVGSGALTLYLLRALAGQGTLYSFERRSEFAEIATANVRAFFGEHPPNWSLSIGELQQTLAAQCAPRSVDRVVLDMLAPWECVDAVAQALVPGGVLVCYVATVTQLSRVVEQLRHSGYFTHPQASETMVRGWHVEGLAVRPDHRMVGHTGFLLAARRLATGVALPQPKRRTSKSEFSEQDAAAWIPDLPVASNTEPGAAATDFSWNEASIGQWSKSDRVLRKKVREAERFARERGAQ